MYHLTLFKKTNINNIYVVSNKTEINGKTQTITRDRAEFKISIKLDELDQVDISFRSAEVVETIIHLNNGALQGKR